MLPEESDADNCKTAKAKALAKQVKVRLVKQGVAPSHIDIKPAHGLTHDPVITHMPLWSEPSIVPP